MSFRLNVDLCASVDPSVNGHQVIWAGECKAAGWDVRYITPLGATDYRNWHSLVTRDW